MDTGIYHMPFADYADVPAINGSALVKGKKSMLHMRAEMIKDRHPATPAMRFGTLAHTMVLEAGRGIGVCDAKRGSAAWQAAEEAAGSTELVCKSADYARALAMRDALMADTQAAWMIEHSAHELSMFWSGKYGEGKGRVDAYNPRTDMLWDYKTTADITPAAFFRTAENMSYALKMGWYTEGLAMLGRTVPDVWLIVQETVTPYDHFICHMNKHIIEQGREEAVSIAMNWACCNAAGSFPGVAARRPVIEFERPAWARAEDEEKDVSDGEMTAADL